MKVLSFVLQTARLSRGLDDHVKQQSRPSGIVNDFLSTFWGPVVPCACSSVILRINCTLFCSLTYVWLYGQIVDAVVWLRPLVWSLWSFSWRDQDYSDRHLVASHSSADRQNWHASSTSWTTYPSVAYRHWQTSSSGIGLVVVVVVIVVCEWQSRNQQWCSGRQREKWIKTMSVLRKLHNNTNVSLKTAQCMIYQVLSLFYLPLFPPPAENCCSLA